MEMNENPKQISEIKETNCDDLWNCVIHYKRALFCLK